VGLASALLSFGAAALIPLAPARPAAYAGIAAYGALLFVLTAFTRSPAPTAATGLLKPRRLGAPTARASRAIHRQSLKRISDLTDRSPMR
jgi:hypothetical protein